MFNTNPNMGANPLGYSPQSLQAPTSPVAAPGQGPAQMVQEDIYNPDYKKKMSMLADMLRQQGAPSGGMAGAVMGGLGQGAQLGQSLSGLMG